MYSKALIIDDDNASRRLVRYFFEMMGCQTAEAIDGEMGSLRLLNESQDLLVLDWRMPNLTGGDTLLMVDSVLKQAVKPSIQSPLPTILYTSVLLEELELPETKHFRFKGYVYKKWPLHLQKKQFQKILKSLQLGAI